MCDLVQVVLLDLLSQVRLRPDELRVLDDAGVHVDEVQTPIRCVVNAHWSEERIGRSNELRFRVGVPKLRQSVGHHDFGAAHDSSHRLVEEEIADQIRRKTIAAIDLDARRRGEVIERAVGQPDATHAALHVGDAARCRPRHLKVGLEVVGNVEGPVGDWRLEVDGADFTAAIDPPHLAVVVLSRPPLPAVGIGLLAQHLAVGRNAQAERVVGHVEPVVERPGQAAWLPLHVGDAARAGIEQFLLVGDTVAVRVRVLVHVAVVGLEREDHAVPERKRNPRHHHVVHEHRVLVVDAVAVGVFVPRNPADRRARVRTVRVLHVGAHFQHVHATVAIEGHTDRILDQRVGQHRLDLVAGRQQEHLLLRGRILTDDWRTLQEVRGVVESAAALPASGTRRRSLRCRTLRRGSRWRLSRDERAAERARAGRQEQADKMTTGEPGHGCLG